MDCVEKYSGRLTASFTLGGLLIVACILVNKFRDPKLKQIFCTGSIRICLSG